MKATKTISSSDKPAEKPGFWRVFRSVAASMFGVQSEKNRMEDFQQTSFMPFIIVGVLFVVGFVLSLIGIVNLIL